MDFESFTVISYDYHIVRHQNCSFNSFIVVFTSLLPVLLTKSANVSKFLCQKICVSSVLLYV